MGGLSLATSFECSQIFNGRSAILVGRSSVCQWTTLKLISITLSSDASVVAGDSLEVRANTIYNMGGLGSAVTGSVVVSFPNGGEAPTVSMAAPSQVGACDQFVSKHIIH